MSARAAALIVPLALLAGCATAPRTTYHYDGRGDYYTGATPGTDVVIASPWHAGWGLGGWGPAGYGYGGGYFGSGYYGSPWTGWYGGGFGYGYGYSPWWGWGGAHNHAPQPSRYPRTARGDRPDRWDFPPRRVDETGVAAGSARGAPLVLPASAGFAPDRSRGVRLPSAPRSAPTFERSREASPRQQAAPSAPVRSSPPPMRQAPPPMRAPQPSFERSSPPPSRVSSNRQ